MNHSALRRALIVVSTASERDVVISRFGGVPQHDEFELLSCPGIDAWKVAFVTIGLGEDGAGDNCEEAIDRVNPTILLFVGSAVAAHSARSGEVLVADRVARPRRPGSVANARAITRTASFEFSPWVERLLGNEEWKQARVGSVLTSREALPSTQLATGLPDIAATDIQGWDFLPGLYGDDNLPAMAIYGLCPPGAFVGESPDAALGAADRAAAFARALLLSAHDSDSDPLSEVAEEGAAEHGHLDAEVLSLERPKGFLQRPFLSSGRAGQSPVPEQQQTPSKDVVAPARLTALIRTAGSQEQTVLPPDLKISIELHDRTLRFYLDTTGPGTISYNRKFVGETELSGRYGDGPKAYRESIKRQVREIAAAPQESDEDALQNLGTNMFDDLFPNELKQEYAVFAPCTQTLMIKSEEPWIPWELVRPYSDDYDYDEDFLGVRFDLTRWYVDRWPTSRFHISYVASLDAGAVEGEVALASAKHECQHLRSIALRCNVEDLTPPCAEWRAVKELLHAGHRVHLWHVAAHGRLDRDSASGNYVVLADGKWKTTELTRQVRTSIKRAHPLVFFNACLVANQDFSLRELKGWPAAWIDCECGAFLGPQWSVSSELAAEFARSFYDALERGERLGRAATLARKAVRERAPLDPAWLSYAVYGHPNAEVAFGRSDEPQPAAA